MKLAENLLEKYVLDCMYFLFTKITYILTPPAIPTSLEQSLRTIEVLSPGWQSSFCSK